MRYYFTLFSEATVSYSYQDQLETHQTNHTVYNVSQLLDSLLSNYDNSLRPDTGGEYKHQVFCFLLSPFPPGPPVLIEVNMQVRSMGPISEMDMVSREKVRHKLLTILSSLLDFDSTR